MQVRIAALAAVAIAAVAPAAYSSASSSVDRQPVADSGFAGPVHARPRGLDLDLASSASTLRAVRCASAAPGTRCWITLSLK